MLMVMYLLVNQRDNPLQLVKSTVMRPMSIRTMTDHPLFMCTGWKFLRVDAMPNDPLVAERPFLCSLVRVAHDLDIAERIHQSQSLLFDDLKIFNSLRVCGVLTCERRRTVTDRNCGQ